MPLITVVGVPGHPDQTHAFLGPTWKVKKGEKPKPTPASPKSSRPAVKGPYTAAPHPSYPNDAVRKRLEGTGVFEVYFRSDGSVSHVALARSTGHWALDKECISTFKTWRCHPGRVTWFCVPVTFVIDAE